MDPKLSRFFAAISALAKLAGVLLVGRGVISNDSPLVFWLQFISGTIMILGPAIYDVWASGRDVVKALAVGAQAGINMTLAGKTVDHEGKPISSLSADAIPPLPVTEAAGVQIAKDYGPASADVPKG